MAEDTTQGTSTPGEGEDASGGRFGRAKEFAGQQYTRASGAVRDGYSAVRGKVDDVDFPAVVDQVRSYVRSNPGKAMVFSIGIGFVIGLMLRSDDDD